jgi:hypothetical protein
MARTIPTFAPLKRIERAAERPAGSLWFDGIISLLGAWFVGGAFLDGWAHQHIPSLETFFTPWHAVLYSGFMALASALVARALLNYARGYPLRRALPIVYDLSLLGVALFMLGGVADLAWHSLFGIEANIQALLSPTHLLLALGGTLTVTGPLRSAWNQRSRLTHLQDYVPMLLSALYVVSLLAFFTQYANPFGETFPAAGLTNRGSTFSNQAVGILGILIQAALLMGVLLLVVRRFTLPFGSITLIIGASTVLMVLMRNDASFGQSLATGPLPIIGVGLIGGLAGDALLAVLRPSEDRPGAFRVFAFLLPFVLYALYFAAIWMFGGGIGWPIHLWAGTIVQAGIVGWLLSYAFIAPRVEAVD